MSTVNILFPHQLFAKHELYENGHVLYLVEEYLFFREFAFHKIKLAYHRASMKCHEEYLSAKGVIVKYVESTSNVSDIRLLIDHLQAKGVTTIHYINPTDNWLEKRIQSASHRNKITTHEYVNPLFLNSPEELKHFFKPEKKSFYQTTFYKQQRKLRGILMEPNDQPAGGKWTYDIDNRKKYPKGKTPPLVQFPSTDAYWKEAVDYVQEHYANNIGDITQQAYYPHNRVEALKWLDQFLHFRFFDFGHYEDAIVKEHFILHHSLLTPMLNTGLLSPTEILDRSIDFAQDQGVPLNSLEGFVRQIIGWREFIRGMYECKGTYSRTTNFWKFERKIPASFYEGSTGLPPLDDTIRKVIKYGYCHHIERLMILGNMMLLCEFDPDEVYRWFMEMFIDAYDWVMVPNVYGMSQFADGGLFATKPYISSSNYILKMSNYKKGEWQAIWDGLFWRFMDKHRAVFLKNPRMGMLIRTFDKMDDQKRTDLLTNAENFLQSLD